MKSMYTVRLVKSPDNTREWTHSNLRDAQRRAYALRDLHTAPIHEDHNAQVLTVDARKYYA